MLSASKNSITSGTNQCKPATSTIASALIAMREQRHASCRSGASLQICAITRMPLAMKMPATAAVTAVSAAAKRAFAAASRVANAGERERDEQRGNDQPG